MDDSKIIERLLAAKGARAAFGADEETFARICELEDAVVDTTFGMPMENRALKTCMEADGRAILFCDIGFEPQDCHVMTMEDPSGRMVGFDVPECMREKYSSDPDLIWMGEDFAIVPDADMGECRMVMLPQDIGCLGEAEGVRRAVVLYPALEADQYLKSKFGINPDDPEIASAVVGYFRLRRRSE